MNQEIKQKWVVALRSGEYEQGKGSLKTDNKFCCLGVLCDLHAKETGGQWNVSSKLAGKLVAKSYLESSFDLPGKVSKWAELSLANPGINNSGKSLIYLNDYLGYSFDQIADIIEENL